MLLKLFTLVAAICGFYTFLQRIKTACMHACMHACCALAWIALEADLPASGVLYTTGRQAGRQASMHALNN
jgi:hypothetical protein